MAIPFRRLQALVLIPVYPGLRCIVDFLLGYRQVLLWI